jgi:hypothetical protein
VRAQRFGLLEVETEDIAVIVRHADILTSVEMSQHAPGRRIDTRAAGPTEATRR